MIRDGGLKCAWRWRPLNGLPKDVSRGLDGPKARVSCGSLIGGDTCRHVIGSV
jgi:hypothetical protein